MPKTKTLQNPLLHVSVNNFEARPSKGQFSDQMAKDIKDGLLLRKGKCKGSQLLAAYVYGNLNNILKF